jgi:uncharacterized membrane protein YdbT with pleckstrin-like domain
MDSIMWRSSSSQIVNLNAIIINLVFFWLIFPIFILIWRWLKIKNRIYELSQERLRLTEGVLNREINELELYRIRDYKLTQPFFLRLFGLSNIILETSDRSHPQLIIEAVKDGENVLALIRTLVENCRAQKAIREFAL